MMKRISSDAKEIPTLEIHYEVNIQYTASITIVLLTS